MSIDYNGLLGWIIIIQSTSLRQNLLYIKLDSVYEFIYIYILI